MQNVDVVKMSMHSYIVYTCTHVATHGDINLPMKEYTYQCSYNKLYTAMQLRGNKNECCAVILCSDINVPTMYF